MKSKVIVMLLALFAVAHPLPSPAQGYPDRPIRVRIELTHVSYRGAAPAVSARDGVRLSGLPRSKQIEAVVMGV